MKNLLAIALLIASQAVVAQKTIALENFKNIEIRGGLEIQLIHSNENKLISKSNQDEGVDIKYNNETLVLEGEGTAVLYYNSDLEGIVAGSDTHIAGSDEIKSKSFTLTAGTDSQISLNFKVKELVVTAGSDSQVALKGSASDARFTLGSDCKMDSKSLAAANVTITMGSDADAMITSTGEVTATVGSDGNLMIYGKPKNVNEVKGGDAKITVM